MVILLWISNEIYNVKFNDGKCHMAIKKYCMASVSKIKLLLRKMSEIDDTVIEKLLQTNIDTTSCFLLLQIWWIFQQIKKGIFKIIIKNWN